MLTRDGEQSLGPWPSIQRGDYVSAKGGPGAVDPGDEEPDPRRIASQPDFGRELTLVRQRAGLTVREVARAVGIPASTAGDYFAGRHLPPLLLAHHAPDAVLLPTVSNQVRRTSRT